MQPLISIVIPFFNSASYIASCLDTVLKQTYPSFEVLLINDASTDRSVEVVDAYLEARPQVGNVRLLHNPVNMGPGGCRNRGIEEARGEYIYFADSDDEILPECLELLERPMRHHPFDFVAGGIEIQYTDTSKMEHFLQQQMAVYNASEIEYDHLFESFYKMVVWNKLFRKAFLHKNQLRFIPSNYHDDQLFLFQLAFCTRSYTVVPYVTYRYFKHEGSITGQYKKKNYDDLILVLTEMSRFVKQNSMKKRQLRAALKHIFMLQCNLSMHVLDSITIPRNEQARYLHRFGKIGLPLSQYLAIPKGYWRDRIAFPLFYLWPPLFIFIYRIIQRLTPSNR